MPFSTAFAPTNGTVTNSSAALVAADADMSGCTLHNTDGSTAVYLTPIGQTAVALKGVVLSPGETKDFFGGDAPVAGFNAITASSTAVVAIQKR